MRGQPVTGCGHQRRRAVGRAPLREGELVTPREACCIPACMSPHASAVPFTLSGKAQGKATSRRAFGVSQVALSPMTLCHSPDCHP